MDISYELLVPTYDGEMPDDAWDEEIKKTESEYRQRISEFRGEIPVGVDVSTKNIGRGADWLLLAISITSAAIVIPEAHKRIRENIEEWGKIYRELQAFFNWVLKDEAAIYPDEHLFLKSIESLSDSEITKKLEYKGVLRIPNDNPDFSQREDLIFSFNNGNNLVQVAISRTGEILWKNTIQL